MPELMGSEQLSARQEISEEGGLERPLFFRFAEKVGDGCLPAGGDGRC
jgi:hypothetical protein